MEILKQLRYLVTGLLLVLFVMMMVIYSFTPHSGVQYELTITEHAPNHTVPYNIQEVMKNRTNTIQKVCKNLKEETHNKLNTKLYSRLWVDDKYKLIYCVIPKVACTNWKRVFIYLSGKVNISDPEQLSSRQVHHGISEEMRTLDTYTVEEVRYRLKNYLKFMFVREPLERLLSAYKNKFTLRYNQRFHQKYGTQIIKKYRTNATKKSLNKGHDVTFEEFVKYLIDPEKRVQYFNAHWRPISYLCQPCSVKYDIIGKYETFNKDVEYVLSKAGINNLVDFPQAPERIERTKEVTREFYKKIPTSHIQKLYQLYSVDYEMFGYPHPKFR